MGPNAPSGPDFVSPVGPSAPTPAPPGPLLPPPGPPAPRRTPVLAIVLVALLVAALNSVALTLLYLRYADQGHGPNDAPTASSSSAPTAPPELGDLGRELTAAGYACTLELPEPMISGCYARAGDSRSLRWQGPSERPTALSVYVLSTAGGYDFPAQLDSLLSSLSASGIWTAADLAAVRASAAGLREGRKAEVDTSWGGVTLDKASVSLVLHGTRTGAKVPHVEGREFPTAITDLEQEAVDLGYRCQRMSDRGLDERTCSGSTGNEMTISAFDGEAVTSLFGGFVNPAGQSAFSTLVRAASPADGPALTAVLNEAATTPTLAYRASSGFLVLCQRTDAVRCSVYGVGWD